MSSTGTIGFGSNYQLTEGSGIYWNSGSNYGVVA